MQFKSSNCNAKVRVLRFSLHLVVLHFINFYVEQIYLNICGKQGLRRGNE
jgi:hypothetical protein